MTNLICLDNSVNMGKLEELRAILKAKIANKEITQKKIAQISGADNASISRFLNKDGGLSLDNFLNISDHLGAKLFWPHELSPALSNHTDKMNELSELRDQVHKLTGEKAELLSKIVALYEAGVQIPKADAPPPAALPPSQEQPGDNGG